MFSGDLDQLKVAALLGVKRDDALTVKLERALQNGLAFAPITVPARRSAPGPIDVDLKNELIATAATYAAGHVPDTLKALGVGPRNWPRNWPPASSSTTTPPELSIAGADAADGRGSIMSPHAWYGCRRDLRDARDHLMALRPVAIPPKVDLRPWCPPVMDQGDIGSCTAHGVTTAARFHIIKTRAPPTTSRCHGCSSTTTARARGCREQRCRRRDPRCDQDARQEGCRSRRSVALRPGKFSARPPAEVYDDAPQYKALKYARVPIEAAAVKQAIASGNPVIIGISVYDSFESDEVAKTGMVPMPAPHEKLRRRALHAWPSATASVSATSRSATVGG